MHSLASEKAVLRARLRVQRQQLDPMYRQAAANAAVAQLMARLSNRRLARLKHVSTLLLDGLHRFARIGLYYPLPEEFDSRPLLRYLKRRGFRCYLPRIPAPRVRTFTHPYQYSICFSTKMQRLHRRVPRRLAKEGADSRNNLWKRLPFHAVDQQTRWKRNRFGIWEPSHIDHCYAERLDYLFVPVVAVDRFGYRLGLGGGYYDCSLATCQPRRPVVIGLAYAFQQQLLLPTASWDQPIDALLTEAGWTAYPAHPPQQS